jgi:flagellar biosynthesis/type III secretory pathway ATPase
VAARPATPVAATIREVIAPADRALVSEAIAALRDRSAVLSESLSGVEKPPVDQVLDHSRATTEALVEILSRSSARQVRRIAADLGEVQDLMMLMQLEKGAAPADDALTLLLQILRDLETLLAA